MSLRLLTSQALGCRSTVGSYPLEVDDSAVISHDAERRSLESMWGLALDLVAPPLGNREMRPPVDAAREDRSAASGLVVHVDEPAAAQHVRESVRGVQSRALDHDLWLYRDDGIEVRGLGSGIRDRDPSALRQPTT